MVWFSKRMCWTCSHRRGCTKKCSGQNVHDDTKAEGNPVPGSGCAGHFVVTASGYHRRATGCSVGFVPFSLFSMSTVIQGTMRRTTAARALAPRPKGVRLGTAPESPMARRHVPVKEGGARPPPLIKSGNFIDGPRLASRTKSLIQMTLRCT